MRQKTIKDVLSQYAVGETIAITKDDMQMSPAQFQAEIEKWVRTDGGDGDLPPASHTKLK